MPPFAPESPESPDAASPGGASAGALQPLAQPELPAAVQLGMELRRRGMQPPAHLDAVVGEFQRRGLVGQQPGSSAEFNLSNQQQQRRAAQRFEQVEDTYEPPPDQAREQFVEQGMNQYLQGLEQAYMDSPAYQRQNDMDPLGRLTQPDRLTGAQRSELYQSFDPQQLEQRREQLRQQFDAEHSPVAEFERQRQQAGDMLAQSYRQAHPEADQQEVLRHTQEELARLGYTPSFTGRLDPVVEEEGPARDERIQLSDLPYVGDFAAPVLGTPVRAIGDVASFGAGIAANAMGEAGFEDMQYGALGVQQALGEGTGRLLRDLRLGRADTDSITRNIAADLGQFAGDLGAILLTRNPAAASRLAAVAPGMAYFGLTSAGAQQNQVYETLLGKGYDAKEASRRATLIGAATGAANALIERIPLENYLIPGNRSRLWRAFRGAMAEGSTESAQELTTILLEMGVDANDSSYWENLGRVLYAGGVGAIGGGAVAGLMPNEARTQVQERATRGNKLSQALLTLDNKIREAAQRFRVSRGRQQRPDQSPDEGEAPVTTRGARRDPRVMATPRQMQRWHERTYGTITESDQQSIQAAFESAGERFRLADVPLSAIESLGGDRGQADPRSVQQIAGLSDQEVGDMPPVVLTRDPESGAWNVADGQARLLGLQRRGDDTIRAYVPQSLAQQIEAGELSQGTAEAGRQGAEQAVGPETEPGPQSETGEQTVGRGERRPRQADVSRTLTEQDITEQRGRELAEASGLSFEGEPPLLTFTDPQTQSTFLVGPGESVQAKRDEQRAKFQRASQRQQQESPDAQETQARQAPTETEAETVPEGEGGPPLRGAEGAQGREGERRDEPERLRRRAERAEEAYEREYDLRRRDPLTGIYNRLGGDEQVQALLDRAGRENKPVAVYGVDLVLFKQVNDAISHAAGDAALAEAANAMEQSVRSGEDGRPADVAAVVSRRGGDEFEITAYDVTPEQAEMIGGRMQQAYTQALERMGIELPGALKPLLAFGFTVRQPDTDTSIDALRHQADQDLEARKEQLKAAEGIPAGRAEPERIIQQAQAEGWTSGYTPPSGASEGQRVEPGPETEPAGSPEPTEGASGDASGGGGERVQVVRADPDAVPAGDEATMRRAARQHNRQHHGQMVENPTLGQVQITRAGMYKATSHRGMDRPQFLATTLAPELLERARLRDSQPDRQGRPNIKQIHTLYAAAAIEGELYAVKLTVRETHQGQRFYDQHTLAKTKTPASDAGVDLSGGEGSTARPLASASTISIDALLGEGKPSPPEASESPGIEGEGEGEGPGTLAAPEPPANVPEPIESVSDPQGMSFDPTSGVSDPEGDVGAEGAAEGGAQVEGATPPTAGGWTNDMDPLTAKEGRFRRQRQDREKRITDSIARARARRDGEESLELDNIYRITADTARRFNLGPAGVGRAKMLKRWAAGFYRVKPEAIRLRRSSYVSTFVHELGHHLHKTLFPRARQTRLGISASDFPQPWRRELERLGKDLYGKRKPVAGYAAEGWAETVRFLVTNPAHLKQRAPTVYAGVVKTLVTEHPGAWLALLDARVRLLNAVRIGQTDPVDQFVAHDETRLDPATWNPMSAWDWFRTRFTDRWHRLQVMKSDLGLDDLPADVDLHIMALRANGHNSGDIKLMMENGTFDPADPARRRTGPGFVEVLRPLEKGDNRRLWQNYMVARRAIEKRGQGYDVLPQDPRMPDQTSNERLKEYIARVEKQHPEFGDFFRQRGEPEQVGVDEDTGEPIMEPREAEDTVAARFRGFNNWLIKDYAVHYGLVSEDVAQLIVDRNLEYITFRHKKTEDAVAKGRGAGGSSTGGFANQTSGIRRFREGVGEQVFPPLESFVTSIQGIVGHARLNEVAGEITQVFESGIDGAGRWLDKIDRPMEATKVNADQLSKAVQEQLGISVSEGGQVTLPSYLEGLTDEQFAGLVQAVRGITSTTFWKPGNRTDRDNREVTVLRGGEPQFYEVKDARLFDLLEGLGGPASTSALMKVIRFPPRLLRATATQLNVSFSIPNFLRDLFQSLAMTESDLRQLNAQRRARLTGIREAFTGGDWYNLFLASGADMAGLYGEHYNPTEAKLDFDKLFGEPQLLGLVKGNKPTAIAKDLLTLGPVQRFNEALEMANRLAEFRLVYEQARGAGKREATAIAEGGQGAADITVDFQRAGTWVRSLNEGIVFLNAAVQGTDKIGRFIKKHPLKALGRVFTFTMLPSLISMLMNWDNEDYWAKPLEMRDRYWYFPTGYDDNGDPTYLKVPKPYGLAAFSIAAERGFAYTLGIDPTDPSKRGDPGALEGAGWAVFRELRPTMSLAGVQPIFEVMANYSVFWGGEIVSRADQDLPLGEQGARKSSDLARVLGDFLDYPPAKIDYLTQGFLGGLGRDVVQVAVDPAVRLASPPENPGEPLEFEDWLVVRRFLDGETQAGHEAIGRFFRTYEHLKRVNGGLSSREESPDRYDAYARRHDAELALWPAYSDARGRMGELFGELREAYRTRDQVTADELERRVSRLYDEIIGIAQETHQIRRQALDEQE